MTPGRSRCDRREFLAAGLGVFLSARTATTVTESSWGRPSALQQAQDTSAGPNGRLYDPTWAGPSVQPVTARDNDAAIQAIEKRIKCTCGCGLDVYTCRTTDFTCPVSPKMHAQVLRLAESGNSARQIIAAFVQEHGIEILMAPPRSGFNLIGYYAPYALIAAAGVFLIWAMSRWVRRGAPAPATIDAATAGASAAELEGLQEALRRTEA
ncbi:MAG TPA: cytochrome c-type biogenesis protein CcmH [Gemmatimonadales bacterium]|jgi:cytochrome c-type biogenesis protein CcmH/NrfF